MLTQDLTTRLRDWCEIENLTLEIFATTSGYNWQAARDAAVAQYAGLVGYAADWDFDAECQAIASETPADDDDDPGYEVQYDDVPYPDGIGNPDAGEAAEQRAENEQHDVRSAEYEARS